MDALSRLAPVARSLLRDVDDALSLLGAPADHPVWALLRHVGATPADAVAFFADAGGLAEGRGLDDTADALREQCDSYLAMAIPTGIAWEGGASEVFTATAGALDAHLRGGPDETGGGMAGRLELTASYVDEIAAWQQRSRDRLARTLAEALTSAQAVAMRVSPPGGAGVVAAAADIAAAVLEAAADALDDGRDLCRQWGERLTELSYRPPVHAGPGRFDATIRLGQ